MRQSCFLSSQNWLEHRLRYDDFDQWNRVVEIYFPDVQRETIGTSIVAKDKDNNIIASWYKNTGRGSVVPANSKFVVFPN
jgi:hypothetical protein